MWMLFAGCLIREDVYLKRKAELAAMEEDDTAPVDSDCTLEVFIDADGDGWGNAAYPATVCAMEDGYAESAGDCDDGDGAVYPGAVETCATEWDDDCDGSTDGAVDAPIWYADEDGDGFGDIGAATAACDADGRVADATDCDDDNARVNPGEDEVCGNGLDDDCDEDVRECRLEGGFAAEDADVVWEGETTGGLFAIAPGDVDGDGLADVGFSAAGVLHVAVGPVPGVRWVGDDDRVVFELDTGLFVGAVVGDLDGDVSPDIVTSVRGDVWSIVRFDGPLGGLRDASDGVVLAEGTDTTVTLAPSTADFDGDGIEDTWVGEPNTSGPGVVRVVDAQASEVARIEGEDGDYFGYTVHTSDLSGDGLEDLLVTAPFATGAAATYLFESPVTASVVADADARFIAELDAIFGAPFVYTPAGDANGDGQPDLWLSSGDANGHATGSGEAYLHLGPFSGDADTVSAEATLSGDEPSGGFGSSVSVGDVDGDGVADVLVGAHDGLYTQGDHSSLFYGPIVGVHAESEYDVRFAPAELSNSYGWFSSIAGDVDGDGLGDMLSAEDESESGVGRGYLWFGRGD